MWCVDSSPFNWVFILCMLCILLALGSSVSKKGPMRRLFDGRQMKLENERACLSTSVFSGLDWKVGTFAGWHVGRLASLPVPRGFADHGWCRKRSHMWASRKPQLLVGSLWTRWESYVATDSVLMALLCCSVQKNASLTSSS